MSFRTAPVSLRETLTVAAAQRPWQSYRVKAIGALDEVVVLSTCNRVEIYGASARRLARLQELPALLAAGPCALDGRVYVREGAAALAHLFAVTSGLDSMVLGETEITGQVKEAYEHARAAGLTGRTLNPVFQKALQTAKEIRTRTYIGRGATSVGSVAAEVAEKIFGPRLPDQAVVVVGTGAVGAACLRHLAKKGAKSVVVCNRDLSRGAQLATECGGRAIRVEESKPALAGADIIITATTCPHFLLTPAEINSWQATRGHRPLFLVDLAVPRNIDPDTERLANVYLYNIDDLEAILRQNVHAREQELAVCQEIINRKVAALLPRLVESSLVDPPGLFGRQLGCPPVTIPAVSG